MGDSLIYELTHGHYPPEALLNAHIEKVYVEFLDATRDGDEENQSQADNEPNHVILKFDIADAINVGGKSVRGFRLEVVFGDNDTVNAGSSPRGQKTAAEMASDTWYKPAVTQLKAVDYRSASRSSLCTCRLALRKGTGLLVKGVVELLRSTGLCDFDFISRDEGYFGCGYFVQVCSLERKHPSC